MKFKICNTNLGLRWDWKQWQWKSASIILTASFSIENSSQTDIQKWNESYLLN